MEIFYIALWKSEEKKMFRFLLDGFNNEGRKDLLGIVKSYNFKGRRNSMFSPAFTNESDEPVGSSYIIEYFMKVRDGVSSQDVAGKFLSGNGEVKGTIAYVEEFLRNSSLDSEVWIRKYNPKVETELIEYLYEMRGDRFRLYDNSSKPRKGPFASIEINGWEIAKQIFLDFYKKHPNKLYLGSFNRNSMMWDEAKQFGEEILKDTSSIHQLILQETKSGPF